MGELIAEPRPPAPPLSGSIAGSSAAAALARRSLDVLLCEAGLPSERRLAGELTPPPAPGPYRDGLRARTLVGSGEGTSFWSWHVSLSAEGEASAAPGGWFALER